MAKEYSNPDSAEQVREAAADCSREQGGASIEGQGGDPIKETGTAGYDGWDKVGKED